MCPGGREAMRHYRSRSFFVFLVISFSGSAREADTALKILKARIGAERIEARSRENPGVKTLLVTLFEPMDGLIRIAEGCIDHRDLRTVRVNRVRSLL